MCALDELYTDDSKDNYVMEKVIKYSTTVLKQLPQTIQQKKNLVCNYCDQSFENQVSFRTTQVLFTKLEGLVELKEHSRR